MSPSQITVAHLTSVHPVEDVRIFQKECRALATAGFAVTMVGSGEGERMIEGIRVLGGSRWSGGRLRRMTIHLLRFAWRALRVRTNIAHFHDPELIPLGLILKLLGRKVIYDVHEDVPRDILTKSWLPVPLRRPIAAAMGRLEIFAAGSFDGVVAATPTIACRFPAAKTLVVRNYARLEEFAQSGCPYAERPLTVGYVGVLFGKRGLFEMVEAAGRVRNGSDPALLLGGYFQDAEEEARARRMLGWERVAFEGWLDRPAVTGFFGRIRAGLAPFHPTPSLYDALPVKVFEYMAAGLPVIASDFPLYREILSDGAHGLLVEPTDPAALTAAIQWVLNHPDEAELMGRRGREATLTRYNWLPEAERLVAFYRRLTETGP